MTDLKDDLETVHYALSCAYKNLGIRANESFPDFEALARITAFVSRDQYPAPQDFPGFTLLAPPGYPKHCEHVLLRCEICHFGIDP